MSDKIKLC